MRRERLVHILFDVGVLIKGFDGVLQTAGGVLLLSLGPSQIQRIVRALTEHELSRDPNDFVARTLAQAAASLSVDAQLFGALYLLAHGILKVGLVAALLKRQLWAYPLAIVVFSLFLVYQMYRYALGHSVWMLALSVLDVFVIVITWLEYRRVKAAW